MNFENDLYVFYCVLMLNVFKCRLNDWCLVEIEM